MVLAMMYTSKAKVGGFSLAASGDEYEDRGAKYPLKWTAPETVMRKKWDTKSDVWSYGITMWEIFSLGVTPYPHFDNARTIQGLKQGYRMPVPDYHFSQDDTKNALYMVSFWKNICKISFSILNPV